MFPDIPQHFVSWRSRQRVVSAGPPLSASFIACLLAALCFLTSCSRLDLTPVTLSPSLSLKLFFSASVSASQKPSLTSLFKMAHLPLSSYFALFSFIAGVALCGIIFMNGQVIFIYSTDADWILPRARHCSRLGRQVDKTKSLISWGLRSSVER